ncbi:MAG TPA: HAD family hydrolase [Methanomassiliicoccales archaeon]|nr:HAD family hydrolase [Methanomassiliicoccales archaeon]
MKAVVFDLGHTLIDYYIDWRGPENRAISDFYRVIAENMDDPPEKNVFVATMIQELENARSRRRMEMIEIPLSTFLGERLKQFDLRYDEEVIQEGLEIFYGALLEHRKLIPGTLEMLQNIKKNGYKVGLISDVAWGLPSYFPKRDMTFYKLDVYFDDLVFSTDVGLRKPNPRIFKIALENLGVGAGDAAYVGNSLQSDIRGALDSGLKAILKKSNYFFPDDSVVPDAYVDDWSELKGILDAL